MLAVLLISFLSPPVQSQSNAILQWTEVNKPGAAGHIIINPSEINKIAVSSSDVIYSLDSANGHLYKSVNSGITWTELTGNLMIEGAAPPFIDIAAAPDNQKIVAAVTGGGTSVYASIDGGITWSNTSVPGLSGTTLQCIGVSRGYYNWETREMRYDIAIGTALWGNTNSDGQLWIRTLSSSSLSAWTNQNLTVDGSLIGGEVSSIAFSPNYESDSIILVVASTGNDVAATYRDMTVLSIGKRDLAVQTTVWNPADYPNYPVSITNSGDEASPPVPIVISCISLPSNFVGSTDDPGMSDRRKVFVSYNRNPDSTSNNDVYRIDDTVSSGNICERLNAAGGTGIDIASIAYYGTATEGKLIAGESIAAGGTVQVRRTMNPLETPALPAWIQAEQPPTGPGNAMVAWNNDGTIALCGTGQQAVAPDDESAFSRSIDNGNRWEQVSLINTTINVSDIAVTPDSKGMFMSSYNNAGTEGIWRSAGDPIGEYWGRILTMETSPNKVILRLSADYANERTIYAAEAGNAGSPLLYVSPNGGNTWFKRMAPAVMVDTAIANEMTAYAGIENGYIRKTMTAGRSWNAAVWTGIDEINMMHITPNGHLFIGSRDSKAAYSTDGGISFEVIPEALSSEKGDVQIVADADYSSNNTIYAAVNISDHGTWRWIIGSSTTWEQIDRPITDMGTGQLITGLASGKEGTLYVLRGEAVNGAGTTRSGGMNRTLNPTERYTTNIEWDIVNQTLPAGTSFNPLSPAPVLPNTLPQLEISGNAYENDLWAADVQTNRIFVFADTICTRGPATVNPDVIGCDPASGRGQEVNVSWEQLSLSDKYEIQIAKDSKFALLVAGIGSGSNVTDFYSPPSITSPAFIYWTDGGAGLTTGSGAKLQPLECGHSYYWRTRTRHAVTGEVIRSPWSDSKKFTIKAGFRVTTPYYGPQLLHPRGGDVCTCNDPLHFSWSPFKESTAYRFELSENPDMSNPVISATVKKSTAYQYEGSIKCNSSYFWRVMAIEPAPSEWSTIFTFTTKAKITTSMTPVQEQQTPLWIWSVLAIGSILSGCLLLLIIRR